MGLILTLIGLDYNLNWAWQKKLLERDNCNYFHIVPSIEFTVFEMAFGLKVADAELARNISTILGHYKMTPAYLNLVSTEFGAGRTCPESADGDLETVTLTQMSGLFVVSLVLMGCSLVVGLWEHFVR